MPWLCGKKIELVKLGNIIVKEKLFLTFPSEKNWITKIFEKFDEEYLDVSRLALYGDSAKMALDSLFSISSLSSKILHQIRNSSLFPYKLSKL